MMCECACWDGKCTNGIVIGCSQQHSDGEQKVSSVEGESKGGGGGVLAHEKIFEHFKKHPFEKNLSHI